MSPCTGVVQHEHGMEQQEHLHALHDAVEPVHPIPIPIGQPPPEKHAELRREPEAGAQRREV